MGLFDYVRSSFPLPEPFMKVNQTKDIAEGISGTMDDYWIDPAGYLWVGEYRGTHSFEAFEEDDPRFNPDFPWINYEWIPTGEHGKFQVLPLTKYIEIYPEHFEGAWQDWPRLKLHFRSGRLIEWEETTGR